MAEARQKALEIQKLLGAGAIKPALRAAKSAQRAHPRNAYFANLAGVAHTRAGDARAAISQFRKAAQLQTGYFEPRRNLVSLFISENRTGEALRLAETLAKGTDPPTDALRLLALARLQAGDASGAEDAASRVLDRSPGDAALLNLRGSARTAQNRYQAALEDYRAAIAVQPGMADALSNMALPLSLMGETAAALEALDQALATDPSHVGALHRRAVQLLQIGWLDEAAVAFRAVLHHHPHHGEALFELAALEPPDKAPALLVAITAAQAATPQKAAAQTPLAFAEYLLKARLGLPGSSDILARANARASKLRRWDADAADVAADAISQAMPRLPAPVVSAPPAPSADRPRPIFILGLPRSGTTLTEQIVSAHPQVHSLGEYPGAETWMQAQGPSAPFGPAEAAALAASYRAGLPPMPETTLAMADKMPGNFRMIGHLLTAFPDATILHMRRDPLDTAWSIWRTLFTSPGLNFAYDQAAMARYFNMYARLMAHWQMLAAARITHVDYADIVADVAAASRRIATAIGLAWHPAMAAPHENAAPVRTASQSQVRMPVHTRSLGGGHAHRAELGRFIKGLDPALWPGIAVPSG